MNADIEIQIDGQADKPLAEFNAGDIVYIPPAFGNDGHEMLAIICRDSCGDKCAQEIGKDNGYGGERTMQRVKARSLSINETVIIKGKPA